MAHKRSNAYIPKIFSDLSGLFMCISTRIMWIIWKSHREIFAIPSSSRHEKRGRMMERFFCLFQCSRNTQWTVWNFWPQCFADPLSILSLHQPSLTSTVKEKSENYCFNLKLISEPILVYIIVWKKDCSAIKMVEISLANFEHFSGYPVKCKCYFFEQN